MASTSAETGTRAELLVLHQVRVQREVDAAGGVRALARKLQINHGYVSLFLNDGVVPKNWQVREKLGIPALSRGARLNAEDNALAQAQGWSSASEFRRWARGGRVQYPKKP